MPIDSRLLEILVCPEDKTPVKMAPESLVDELNRKIEMGSLKSRGGEAVREKIEGGLIRQDGRILYPIRDDIPVMLIEEGIEIA